MSIVYIRFPVSAVVAPQRAPQLEALLARATASSSTEDWRREAFGVIAGPDACVPAVAAARATRAASAAWVCIATPIHCVAGMSNITLADDGLLNLDIAEAQLLACDFQRVFTGSGMRLVVEGAALLSCEFDRPLEVSTSDPEPALGRDVFEFQPAGADAPRLRATMSEIEMWLYDHAVNRARLAGGRPVITGLWLWGGGPLASAAPVVRGWTSGRDPLFAAFGDLQEFPAVVGPGVLVCAAHPASDEWAEVERRWLAPAAAALQSGALAGVVLSTGGRRFHVGRSGRWRFWRRTRPWWEWLQTEGSE